MSRKTNIQSPLQELAIWFYIKVLGNADFSDQRAFRRVVGEAGKLCKPKNGDRPIAPEIVRGTIEALHLFKFGYSSGKVETMWVVMWGHPPYYEQYLSYLNNPPPHWNLAEVKVWEKDTGRIAYPENSDTIIVAPTVPAHVSQQLEF